MKAIYVLFAIVAVAAAQGPSDELMKCLAPVQKVVDNIHTTVLDAINSATGLPKELIDFLNTQVTKLKATFERVMSIISEMKPFQLTELRKTIQELIGIIADINKYLTAEGKSLVNGVGEFIAALNAQLKPIFDDVLKINPLAIGMCVTKALFPFRL